MNADDAALLRSVEELTAEFARLRLRLEQVAELLAQRPWPSSAATTPAASPAPGPAFPSPDVEMCGEIREAEAHALAHLTGKNTDLIEHMLAMAVHCISEEHLAAQCAKLLRSGALAKLDPVRPLAILGALRSRCANPLDLARADLADLYHVPLKPNEQKISGIDTIVLEPRNGGVTVYFTQVKLGGSALSLGTPDSDHARAIAALLPYMVDKSELVLEALRERWPTAQFTPQYVLTTTRKLPKRAQQWCVEQKLWLHDRGDVLRLLPARVQRWIADPSLGPAGLTPPAWLRPIE